MSKKAAAKKAAKAEAKQDAQAQRVAEVVVSKMQRDAQIKKYSKKAKKLEQAASEQEEAVAVAPAPLTPKERYAALKSQGRTFDAAQLLSVHSKSILG